MNREYCRTCDKMVVVYGRMIDADTQPECAECDRVKGWRIFCVECGEEIC